MGLPIDAARERFLAALEAGPVVVSAPTGSGKSTQIPRWCPGPVLVVEPRRVACRTLAARVADLEGCPLGRHVGYQVRDDVRRSADTQIVFVTPGVALLELAEQPDRFNAYGTVILDEFHERSLDTDLLFALLRERVKRLVVMSATLAAERITHALGGQHVHAEGRTFDVDVNYEQDGPAFPTARHLADRVVRAIQRGSNVQGDLLVFLPGKGEIADVKSRLSKGLGREVLELHGGLSSQQQAAVFRTDGPPKVILSTNVAETSVTVPNVVRVIDSGLVRQTRYHSGRGALSLVPIAMDSAEQRRGRAGRVKAGDCWRLWKPSAKLAPQTLPEMHRESLVPLVLAALSCGRSPQELMFLDPPKDHALESALAELASLDAVDDAGALTERGRQLFRLPLDPWLGRLIVEGEAAGTVDEVVDLVSVLAVGRPPFPSAPDNPIDDEDPRAQGCDATAAIIGLRQGKLHSVVQREAEGYRTRLRRALGRNDTPARSDARVDRGALVKTALAADPRAAYVARQRRRQVAWANGGTEIELDRRSALELVTQDGLTKLPPAMVVFGIRATKDGTTTRIIATCAAPLSLNELDAIGLSRPRIASIGFKQGRVVAEVERVFAGKVLGTETTEPEGTLLREALTKLITRGTVFKKARAEAEQRLQRAALFVRLVRGGWLKADEGELVPLASLPAEVEDWLADVLARLGLENQEDLDLIDDADLLPPEVPAHHAMQLDREYPPRVELGDAAYRIEYRTAAREAIFHLERGQRKTPPPRNYLPRIPGFTLIVEAGRTFHRL